MTEGLVPGISRGEVVPGRSRGEVAIAGGGSTDLTVLTSPLRTLTFSATTDLTFPFLAFLTVLGLSSFLDF